MEERLRSTLTTMIQINGLSPLLLNNPSDNDTSGLLILPGHRDHKYRMEEGIRIWQNLKLRYLFLAGRRDEPALEQKELLELTDGKNSPDVFFALQARHTQDQMEWAMGTIEDKTPNLTHLIISSAAYHLPRCYLTLLNSMLRRNILLVLSAIPLYDPQDPHKDFVGYLFTGGTGIEGEANRIMKYQDKGDVASIPKYLEYLKWRISQ